VWRHGERLAEARTPRIMKVAPQESGFEWARGDPRQAEFVDGRLTLTI
jgi:hypothetical protein